MLSNRRQRQSRSELLTSKIQDMFKPSTLGTLSPMTTATTSSGYSTGDSSVSTAAVPCLKKSPASSIGLKQQQQQQHRTKSKGKQKTSEKENKTHLVRGTRHAQAISLALLPMTFSIILSLSLSSTDDDLMTAALHLFIHDSILPSNENRQRSNYCTNLLLSMPLEEIIGLVLC